ncbi:hypothetical protein COW91_03550, partial [Candidatus Nomurabacteria bacterium CG22_combo_CG10-13_8_21_14_all_32_8]
LRELTIPVIANHKFSNQKIKSFLFDLIENIVDEKKLFSKKLEEKEFLINVVELVELNPDLDINILAPYVATLLNQKNISLDSELIKRYYQNTLMPFVNYIKQKNFSVLKQDIIDEITNKERVHKFTNSFSKTD